VHRSRTGRARRRPETPEANNPAEAGLCGTRQAIDYFFSSFFSAFLSSFGAALASAFFSSLAGALASAFFSS
jgi:hypothetical protein